MPEASANVIAPERLVACHECDALYREAPVPPHVQARCRRCDALLLRGTRHGVVVPLALTCAAGILFVVANLSPVMGLEFEGGRNASSLFGAVHALYHQDMRLLATLVLLTTCVAPALDLAAMLYLLLAVQFNTRPAGFAAILRMALVLKPWGMVEVFLLGVLVALVKLAHMATVAPGVALWAYAGVMLLLAAIAATFDPRALWAHLKP